MNEEIGLRVKQARLKADLTQEQLAEMASVSSSFISRLESGKSMPSVERLCMLADVLNVGLQDLLCDLFRRPDSSSDTITSQLMCNIELMPVPQQKHLLEYIQLLNNLLNQS